MQIVFDSIRKAVKEEGQPESLAQALIAWFSELANSNESINDYEAAKRRLNLLLEKTVIIEDLQLELSIDDD